MNQNNKSQTSWRSLLILLCCMTISHWVIAQKKANNSLPLPLPHIEESPFHKEGKTVTLMPPTHRKETKVVSKPPFVGPSPSVLSRNNGIEAVATLVPYIPMYTDPTFEARAINTNLPVGTLGGEGTVTSSGGVTYNIPIVLPPGTNGAMPSLGLNYNSGNNNGQLGLGWSLSGLSTIMRDIHRKSFENDLHEVGMDNGDAFTLDGEHLKPIQGNNGENGTVYDTYNTAFSKITSYTSNNNNGPEWFEVVTKDNLILEYGKTTNSRFLTQEGGVYANKSVMWQLNKVTDPYGNYTEYIYAQNNNTDREPRIIEIRYTGNAAQGLQPYNKVLFEYGDRQDHNSLFMPGVELTTNSVITKITVINEGSPMRIYELAYSYDINTTFLSEITETALGAETMEHFNSTIFKYGNPTTNHYEVNSSGLPSLLSNSANRHDMILDF